MAPESERANVKHADDCCAQALTTCKCGALQRHLAAPATCSEVVERLPKSRAEQFYDAWALRYAERPIGERFVVPHSYEAMFRLMDEYADSWRERRVQELEQALRRISDKTEHTCPTSFRNGSVCCKCIAIGALKAEAERESGWARADQEGREP